MIRAEVRAMSGIIAIAVLVGLAGCRSTETGEGMPTLSSAKAADVLAAGNPTKLVGRLHTDSNGCFLWAGAPGSTEDGAWIVWPDTTRQDADVVVLADGQRVRDGAELTGAGAALDLADLPGGADAGGYFGDMGRYCGADERGVLVLTEVRTAD